MRRVVIAGLCLALLATAGWLQAQDAKGAAAPLAGNEWLKQFAGEWDSDGEAMPAPGQPPIKSKGTESARMLGEHWVIAQGQSTFMEMPFSFVFSLGYDPARQKFVGTWVDSVSSYLWLYEGTLDASGKTLTLESEGPFAGTPGKLAKFRETIEFPSKDQRVFKTHVLVDGKWQPLVTIHSRRKS
jgi:Protein of unknown function (DUF1579)